MRSTNRILKCIAVLLFCIQFSIYSGLPSFMMLLMPVIGLVSVAIAIQTKDE